MENVSKGGSDTVTRFTWNCLPVLPIKTPQTVVVARYIMIYGVLYHRLIQVVSGTKKLDPDTDTIQNYRDRANKRLPFHKSLGILSKYNLSMSTDEPAAQVVEDVFPKTPAPPFNREEKDKQFGVDHSILGKSTGATPIGKGRGSGIAKKFLQTNENYSAIKERNINCTGGFPFRIYTQKDDGNFKLDRQYSCDLCRSRKVTTMCSGCKRILCFEHDRREEIMELLKGDDGDRLREEYPSLSKLQEGEAPAYYTEIGEVNDRKFVMGMSCWHLAHPTHFCSPCSKEDAQLSSVAVAGEQVCSPQISE